MKVLHAEVVAQALRMLELLDRDYPGARDALAADAWSELEAWDGLQLRLVPDSQTDERCSVAGGYVHTTMPPTLSVTDSLSTGRRSFTALHDPPFLWDQQRRFVMRAELDAAFFHLYGIDRDGDRDEAERYFTEAEQLAGGLGETLERAKIWQTRAELLLCDGDASRAQELATSALETFTLSRTRYDITHTRVTLSRAALASGHERLAVQQGALARSAVQVMGYGLLCVLYPEDVFDLAGRIDGALTAYACGDALGVPWENAPMGATPSQIEQLPAREVWPRGATSDDTALTMLVAHHLADRDGDGDPAAFLADLAEQEAAIRGLGPTTTAAIERFRRGDEAADSSGRATNGAAMHALPIGWVLPHDQAERRRQVTIAMSRATHAHPAALVAACVMATCASWALEGASPSLLLEAAANEAREAAQPVTTEARLAEMLTQVSAGTWEPPASGISLDPYETVAAVLWCATRATSLRSGLMNAVQLGGDTDTVAALVGGLMGCKLTAEQVRAELPWHRLVVLPEPESAIAETAVALATARAIQSM